MAFPTTLDIAIAVWSGEARSRYVKLVSGAGIVAVALGPAVSGLLLQHFAWSSVFVVTVPLALVALVLILWLVPNGVNETAGAVDNLGRILPATLIGALALLEYADLMALVCHVSVIG
jgi:MFS family permease